MSTHREDISKLRKNVSIHFKIGLILSTLIVFLIINSAFIIYEKDEPNFYILDDPDDMIVTPPTNQEPIKKVPPPTTIDEVEPLDIVNEVEIDPEPEPEPIVNPNPNPSDAIPVGAPVAAVPSKKEEKKVVPPPVIKPPEPIEEPESIDHLIFAEQMPMFKLHPDENATKNEKKKYADAQMISFINKHVKYPAIARETGIEGTAVVRFIVEKDGSITDLKVLRDPGGGCGKAALAAVKKMPKWEVIGKQNRRPVRVQFTMPIRFQLDK